MIRRTFLAIAASIAAGCGFKRDVTLPSFGSVAEGVELRYQTWNGELWYDEKAHSIAYDQTPPLDEYPSVHTWTRRVFDLYHSDRGKHWLEKKRSYRE